MNNIKYKFINDFNIYNFKKAIYSSKLLNEINKNIYWKKPEYNNKPLENIPLGINIKCTLNNNIIIQKTVRPNDAISIINKLIIMLYNECEKATN